MERLVGEVRKLPPDVHPVVQALWCQPKCFRAMAHHLGALEETAAFVAAIASLPDVPLVIVSSGDQSADTIARHRDLALLSPGVSRTNTGNNERFAETSAVPGTGITIAGQRNLANDLAGRASPGSQWTFCLS